MRKHYPLNSQGAEDAGQMPWKDGVPSTGVEGSYPGQALFTDTEAEILAAIDASGQTRNGSDLTQLIQAIARGIYLGQFAGTANALSAALPNNAVFASLLRGTRVIGFVTATNTAGVTVAISGIGPLTAPATVTAPLLRRNGTALQAGDLPVGQDFEIRWDGAAFRLIGVAASELATPITAASVISFNLANPQGISNGATSQIAIAALAGQSVDFATIANGTVTLTKAGAYVVTFSAGSQIFPTTSAPHANYFYIYVNGAHATGNGYQDYTNANHTNEAAVPLLTWFPAGTTLSGYAYLGGASGDVCQVNFASLTILKVS